MQYKTTLYGAWLFCYCHIGPYRNIKIEPFISRIKPFVLSKKYIPPCNPHVFLL